ncbi:MAG: cache domain-containing protein, partial [Bradyrhizobium sp.]|nr:cache domain-containing protein [Bradyrhizobium sp.]
MDSETGLAVRGLSLTTRLVIAMIMLVAIAVFAVGYLSYRNLERTLLPRVLDRIETHTKLIATDLQAYVRGARADVATISTYAAAHGMMLAHLNGGFDPEDHVSWAAWRRRLEVHLVGDLAVKPGYSQFRFIGVEDGGRELVRVDRSGPGGSVRVVPEAELKQKADRTYFQEAIKLPAGEVYVSAIDLNQDTRTIPTLRVASPIYAPDGKPFGIAVINVDMTSAFERLRQPTRQGEHIFIV